ncbi:MAG: DUF4912 domain-containing protein [Endomicrobiia bacterium]
MPTKKLSTSSRIETQRREFILTIKEELPKTYGDTKIVLMPRDPFWAYAYWEINDSARKEIQKEYGKDVFKKGKLTLRVYDVTGIKFTGKNAHKYFDITINEFADNWYINVPETNRHWCVDLGIVLPDGKFVLIARSNIVKMPAFGVSPITDEQWGVLQKEFEKLLQLSGIEQIGKGSFDVVKLMRERWAEIVSISSAQMPFSPKGISSFRKQEVPAPSEKLKEFWLQADTELIVYGKTERDANLTIAGEKVEVLPDGSFSVRFNLPDGRKEIPVVAESKDKTISKKITFDIIRVKR